jgi:hypothetical protein
VVIKLSALFALDAFAGGFVVQSIMAYWFSLKFGVDVGQLGKIFLPQTSQRAFGVVCRPDRGAHRFD